MQLLAPAKINLSFEIRGRRADGFHEIETLMTPISLCDELTITGAAHTLGIDFRCDNPSLPIGPDNLVIRAAELFSRTTGQKVDATIQLRKKIPYGAGLGGGSSDAAATLLGLNRFYQTNLALAELARLAAEIGSDVAFFLFQSAAICRGRGEIVEPTKLTGTLSFLLLKPSFGVATPWAYSRWKDSKQIPEVSYDPHEFGGVRFVNDLERPVFEKFVFLARAKMWLLKQPEVSAALLSGSGSTVFAILRHENSAESLAARARTELDPELWVCAGKTTG
jgi:4-diphosphocytidyl-2-C-methyl-D-erythritol kinase